MIITDKDGYLHKILVEIIFYAAVNRDNELIIYERLHNNSITICFATKAEAEAVLKQIDARMTAARNYLRPEHIAFS